MHLAQDPPDYQPPPAAFLGTEDHSITDQNERQLRMLDASGNLDTRVVQRIKDMKAEYERQINEYLKEKTKDQIRIETLTKRIQDNE